MKNTNLILGFLVTIFLTTACTSTQFYSRLKYQKNNSSTSTHQNNRANKEELPNHLSQSSPSDVELKKEIRKDELVSKPLGKKKESQPKKELEWSTQSMYERKRESKQPEVVKMGPPACSTIVLKSGETIEGRSIKVNRQTVSFKSCGDTTKILFVERDEVVRIIATTDAENMTKGISEGRRKDRYTNAFSIVYFILAVLALFGVIIILFTPLFYLSFVIGAIGLGVGLLLLTLALTDLSTIHGVGLIVGGIVASIAAILTALSITIFLAIYKN